MCSRAFRPLGLPIYVARVPAAPFSLLPSSLCLLCRSSHSLHSGDVMANEQTSVTRVADREELPLLLDKARRSGTHARLSNTEAGRSGELELFWRELADHGVVDRQAERFDNSASSIGGYRNWHQCLVISGLYVIHVYQHPPINIQLCRITSLHFSSRRNRQEYCRSFKQRKISTSGGDDHEIHYDQHRVVAPSVCS